MEKGEVLLQWIEDWYGSPEELAKVLDLALEMLFYLEEDTFDRKEVQQVVAALRGIVVGLRGKNSNFWCPISYIKLVY